MSPHTSELRGFFKASVRLCSKTGTMPLHNARSRFVNLPLPILLASFATIIVSTSAESQQGANFAAEHVTVFNAVGNVLIEPAPGAFSRIEVESQVSGNFLDRRRTRVQARWDAVSMVLPRTTLRDEALEGVAYLPISADWRFGEGVTARDTLTLSPDEAAPSVRADLKVRLPSGKRVTVRWFSGAVLLAGEEASLVARGTLRSVIVENVNGRLRRVESEGR